MSEQPVGRIPALDGLRTLAVFAVVLWHVGVILDPRVLPLVVGGQAGVDVFFVLSGFVITRLLLAEHQNRGTITLRTFYLRRAQRLMPALLVCLVAVTLTILMLDRFRGQAKYGLLALTYTMDFARAAADPGHGVSSIYGHTWSLAVEEQFYLIWPLLLLWFLRRGHRAAFIGAMMLVALSVAWGALLIAHSSVESNRVYNAPDTRASQIFLGCAAALLLALPNSRAKAIGERAIAWLTWPAAVALVYLILRRPQQRGAELETVMGGLPLNMLMISCSSAVLIYTLATRPHHPLTRLLGLRPLAWFGSRMSYAFYLWHIPVITLAASYGVGPVRRLDFFALTASLLLAYLSARVVERPFTERRRSSNSEARDGEVGVLRQVAVGA